MPESGQLHFTVAIFPAKDAPTATEYGVALVPQLVLTF
jgi:hypothetical protein